jgi:hypothetical protein
LEVLINGSSFGFHISPFLVPLFEPKPPEIQWQLAELPRRMLHVKILHFLRFRRKILQKKPPAILGQAG